MDLDDYLDIESNWKKHWGTDQIKWAKPDFDLDAETLNWETCPYPIKVVWKLIPNSLGIVTIYFWEL